MIQIPPFPLFIIVFGFVMRIIGFILIGAAMLKAASEFLPRTIWLKKIVNRIPHLPLQTSTRKLLLIFTISLWVGSFFPLLQTTCFFIEPCKPIVFMIMIPASMALAVNNVLAGLILYIIYYTKESDPPPTNQAVKDIKASLKTIGQQTRRAEKRSNEIDMNTAQGQGKVLRGRGSKNSKS